MDSVTQSYGVLLVSASAKFMDSVLPLLPERSFSPVTKAPDVSSALPCPPVFGVILPDGLIEFFFKLSFVPTLSLISIRTFH